MKQLLFCLVLLVATPVAAQQRTALGSDPGASALSERSTGTTKKKASKKKRSAEKNKRDTAMPTPKTFDRLDRSYDYAKPPYFGHKRPVKKHPPEKQRMCKKCGIRH
jgi:hypothetical protein